MHWQSSKGRMQCTANYFWGKKYIANLIIMYIRRTMSFILCQPIVHTLISVSSRHTHQQNSYKLCALITLLYSISLNQFHWRSNVSLLFVGEFRTVIHYTVLYLVLINFGQHIKYKKDQKRSNYTVKNTTQKFLSQKLKFVLAKLAHVGPWLTT